MTEYRKNSYSDEDMRDILAQIEKLEAEKIAIMSKAMGECGGVANKVKALKKTAKDDLGIPLKVLNPLLKRRKLERKIEDLNDGIDEDYVEVWEDACGQFAMFAPMEEVEVDAPPPEPEDEPDHVDPTLAELAEGAEVLSQVKH